MPLELRNDDVIIKSFWLASLGTPCDNNPAAFVRNPVTKDHEATCGGVDHLLKEIRSGEHTVSVTIDKS